MKNVCCGEFGHIEIFVEKKNSFGQKWTTLCFKNANFVKLKFYGDKYNIVVALIIGSYGVGGPFRPESFYFERTECQRSGPSCHLNMWGSGTSLLTAVLEMSDRRSRREGPPEGPLSRHRQSSAGNRTRTSADGPLTSFLPCWRCCEASGWLDFLRASCVFFSSLSVLSYWHDWSVSLSILWWRGWRSVTSRIDSF